MSKTSSRLLPQIAGATERGLSFLEKQQDADGSFVSFSSAKPIPFRRTRHWQTTFAPALMLASLSNLENARSINIRERLADFLLEQKSDNWSFNYWSKSAPEYQKMPYPDDLDDTFCALAALHLHRPASIDGAVLAKAVKLLLATESAVGGPYRTWLVPSDSPPVWLDVDPAVNSNVAYFLSLQDSHLPNLQAFMDEAILKDQLTSPYYPSAYPFIYYFARSYQGPHKNLLLQKTRRLHKTAETDLDRSLCLIARLRLGDTTVPVAAVRQLLQGQRSDGSWPAAAFYADPVKNGKLYYNGAPALTTAFVLESLQLYKKNMEETRSNVSAPTETKFINKLLSFAEMQCGSLERELRTAILQSLRKLAHSSNGHEIINLVTKFNEDIRPTETPRHNSLLMLSLANLYGWLAYTVYDDFLDEEGRPELLPVANVAMRYSLDCFRQALPLNKSSPGLVWQTFDIIDGANAWELAHCRWRVKDNRLFIDRFPRYGNLAKLAERSLGHGLTPLLLLLSGGATPADNDFKQVRKAFSCYLIARQLNDDCHDWQNDLTNGHASYVVVKILKDLGVRSGGHELQPLITRARRQFWHESLPKLCDEMQRQIDLGREALRRVTVLPADNVISRLFDGIENSLQETAGQQARASTFMKQYQNTEQS